VPPPVCTPDLALVTMAVLRPKITKALLHRGRLKVKGRAVVAEELTIAPAPRDVLWAAQVEIDRVAVRLRQARRCQQRVRVVRAELHEQWPAARRSSRETEHFQGRQPALGRANTVAPAAWHLHSPQTSKSASRSDAWKSRLLRRAVIKPLPLRLGPARTELLRHCHA